MPSASGVTVAVGEIVDANALRGWLRVRAYQPPAPSLVAGRGVLLERGGEQGGRDARGRGRGLVLLGLDGVCDRGGGSPARHTRLLVRRADFPALDDDEYYHHDVWASPSRRSMVP